MKRFSVALVALVAFGVSHAKTNLAQSPSFVAQGGGYAIQWQNAGAQAQAAIRTIQTNSSTVRLMEKVAINHGGIRVEGAVAREFGRAALGRALGGALVGGAVGVGIALAPTLWNMLMPGGVFPDANGQPVIDPGQVKQDVPGYVCIGQGGARGEGHGLSSACSALMAKLNTSCGPQCVIAYSAPSCVSSGGGGYSCEGQAVYSWSLPTPGTMTSVWQAAAYGETVQLCPKINGGDIGRTYTTGGQPCPSDARVAPTPQQLAEVVEASDKPLAPVVQEIEAARQRGSGWADQLARSFEAEPQLEVEFPPVAGIGTSTTTKPDGSVETKSTSLACSYDGTAAWCTKSTSTTVGGDTTITEDRTTGEAPPTDCDKYPDSLGCIKAGDAPDVPLPEQTRNVAVTPKTGWGASTATCPAPRTISILGIPAEMDNTIFCEFFSGIRWAVLGAFGLASAFIFGGGLRRG